MLLSLEHYNLMAQFERDFKGCFRLDREPKEIWANGTIYQNGDANRIFDAYRKGYAYGVAKERGPPPP